MRTGRFCHWLSKGETHARPNRPTRRANRRDDPRGRGPPQPPVQRKPPPPKAAPAARTPNRPARTRMCPALSTHLSRPPAQSRGIIRPRFEAETAEVVEGILSETPIQRAEVFARGHTVKLHFDGPRPQHVDLWGLRLPVTAAYPRPLQCGACGRLGHTRRACRNPNSCPYCCGRHQGNACRSTTVRCPNCGGHHDAFDRWCPSYTRARAAAREAEDRRVSTATSNSREAQPPPWNAGLRRPRGGPPVNPSDFPELMARDAGFGTSPAWTRGGTGADGGRGENRPAAELHGRAFRARGEAPPPPDAVQAEAAQAPMTGASPSPTGAPAGQDRRPAWQSEPKGLGEGQLTSSPTETAGREHLAPSPPSLCEAACVTTTAAPVERDFPRALRGNKPGFPQGHNTQRGSNLPCCSCAPPTQEDRAESGLRGDVPDLRTLLEQLTRIVAALAQHLPQQSLSGLHTACSAIIAETAPTTKRSTTDAGQR
ncbi:hypothetical protein HPB47_026763 [Ixodes persulcatus]|uniref:Uncharacterized protein n=1 Tax=Ixodes persulcatus TaxID=34615 RepID=A0AC60PZG3_IXOPE|nr:hypothetical protein HPB47_026763 [Ixodes persulcatus]